MRSFSSRIAEDRRLLILKLLERSADYRANEELIRSALADFGHYVSHDLLRTDLGWLEEQELVAVEEIATLRIAHAAQRGLDAARGIVSVPGVKRPAPEF